MVAPSRRPGGYWEEGEAAGGGHPSFAPSEVGRRAIVLTVQFQLLVQSAEVSTDSWSTFLGPRTVGCIRFSRNFQIRKKLHTLIIQLEIG